MRSYLTAGVALAGAGAIALSPVNPIDPHIRDVHAVSVSNSAVALTATVDPITWYNNVFQRTVANAQNLVNVFNANPAPVLATVIANQTKNGTAVANALQAFIEKAATNAETAVPAAFETIGTDLADLDVEGALNTLLNLPIGVLGGTGGFLGVMNNVLPVTTAIKDSIVNPLANAQKVVIALWGNGLLKGVSILLTAQSIFGPLMSGVGAVGAAVQDVIDAGKEGDPIGMASAVVNAPATIADGVLNGGYGPTINALLVFHYPGLLNGNQVRLPLNLGNITGPIQGFVNARDAVVKALGGTLNPVPTPVPVPPIVTADAAAPASLDAAPVSALRAAPDETADDEDVTASDSPKALSAPRLKAAVGKPSDRIGKSVKEMGDRAASDVKSGLKKLGDNVRKALKAKPGKHRASASSAGSES
ncbi:hypothetical protein A5731_25135 [Mycolicibacterium conceptionense]|uniref:PE-PGRS family protein n=1 Tax=Mycolicibacterium conceptionense TaxID=451644 RepID=A0A1A1VPR9_9MYCO|nr:MULTISPECIES: hypothetical protein [Mycolicibacterium]MCW1824334.1 hypothetical protein [Mycolicibacterium senegalense]OBB07835.1 hypothetical protein A5718_15690 [Mycolicibacterium conceptionense]OBE96748.1 hypothetical protein A5731_25135 [Mycolicibacterium conceptionense]OBF26279.1 hypothetical protein A5726_06345 [Mycolicibacterium conceptionense]OBF37613.1 hypothetical protein A5720_19960 [Mycolicibacterium conceptionense]